MELMSNSPMDFNFSVHNEGPGPGTSAAAGLAEAMYSRYSEDAFNPLHMFPPENDVSHAAAPYAASAAAAVAAAGTTGAVAVVPQGLPQQELAFTFPAPDAADASNNANDNEISSESMLITTPLMARLFPQGEEAPPASHQTPQQLQLQQQDGSTTMTSIVEFLANKNSGILASSKNKGEGTGGRKRKRAAAPKQRPAHNKKPLFPAARSNGKLSPTLLGRSLQNALGAQAEANKKPVKKYQYKRVVMSKIPVSSKDAESSSGEGGPSQSPQSRLNEILTSRGYPTKTYTSFECGYRSQSSPLQRASYGTAVLRAVQKSDARTLTSLLQSGLSRNPCNAHGDSVMHMVCKRADFGLFESLIESGASVEVADQFGRTPLHHAAWANDTEFRIVELMLEQRAGGGAEKKKNAATADMFRMTDKTGKTPLEYLPRDKWAKWIDFLERKKDAFFPEKDGSIEKNDGPPYVAGHDGSSSSGSESALPDPDDALPVDVAASVAAGKVDPKDARKEPTT